jgi:hypothetical protein
MFSWMEVHYVCPIAGKFMVNVFTGLTAMAAEGSHQELEGFGPRTWQDWIQDGLRSDMHRLESVKTYLLTPLFSADRRSALEFMKIYNEQSLETSDALSGDWAMLRLAILEVGKKSGLVDEPGMFDQWSVVLLKGSFLTVKCRSCCDGSEGGSHCSSSE